MRRFPLVCLSVEGKRRGHSTAKLAVRCPEQSLSGAICNDLPIRFSYKKRMGHQKCFDLLEPLSTREVPEPLEWAH